MVFKKSVSVVLRCRRSAHCRADRVFASRAAGNIRIGPVEGEVSLVEFADGVAVLPEELAALFHIGLGLGDLALGEQLVHVDAGGVHLGS